MKKQSFVAVVNHIITDPTMYSSTKRVLTTMLAYCSRHNTVRKSLEELAALSGCSVSTVQHALEELEARGIVQRIRCFRYSNYLSRPVYAKNAYHIKRNKLQGSYTLIPRELLAAKISHSSFVVALYVYMKAGRQGRSFASLRTSAKQTDLSKATVCRALKALRCAQILVRYFCIMANRAHSCNSYYPTAWIRPKSLNLKATQTTISFFDDGGLIFIKHPVTNKIAEDLYLEEKRIRYR